MKNLYLLIHLGPYHDHGSWGPLPVEEAHKVEVQNRFLKKRISEFEQGQAKAVVVGGAKCFLEDYLGDGLLFKYKGNFPTDKETQELNRLLQESGEEYNFIPAGFHSGECVTEIINTLLYGPGERLAVSPNNLNIIPDLLIPPVEKLNLGQ